MKNWRVINNNMIQTYSKHVWLWDKEQGVAVLAPVPSRPWKKVAGDFSHWMQGHEGDTPPNYPPCDEDENPLHVAPEQLEEMIRNTVMDYPF